MSEPKQPDAKPAPAAGKVEPKAGAKKVDKATAKEVGGPPGPEPTRYGDWEIKGRCIDF